MAAIIPMEPLGSAAATAAYAAAAFPVLFEAKGGGGDFKLDAGLHGAGSSSGQECFQRSDTIRPAC